MHAFLVFLLYCFGHIKISMYTCKGYLLYWSVKDFSCVEFLKVVTSTWLSSFPLQRKPAHLLEWRVPYEGLLISFGFK